MRGGPRKNSGGVRPGAGRPADPRLTALEAAALLKQLCPGLTTPAERALMLNTRPERIREALNKGCTVGRALAWRVAAAVEEKKERRREARVARKAAVTAVALAADRHLAAAAAQAFAPVVDAAPDAPAPDVASPDAPVDQKLCPHDGFGCGREECREGRCHAQETTASDAAACVAPVADAAPGAPPDAPVFE